MNPEAADYEERAWMRDETFGVLADTEERVRCYSFRIRIRIRISLRG